MAIEQMNISLSPQMARFIRTKVKQGEYTNISEVVRDAVRHMQAAEEARRIELSATQRTQAKRGVARGLRDLQAGAFDDFDEKDLKDFFAGAAERNKRRLAPAAKRKS